MKMLTGLTLLAVCWISDVTADAAVGFEQIVLYTDSEKPLKSQIWYPAKASLPVTRIAENAAFSGTDVVREAITLTGQFPLVIISHGYRGNWRNKAISLLQLITPALAVLTIQPNQQPNGGSAQRTCLVYLTGCYRNRI